MGQPARERQNGDPRLPEHYRWDDPHRGAGERAGQVRVIAGQYDDVSGPAHTFSPLNVWDLQLNQGHDLTLRQPEGWSTALVVLEGEVIINGSESAREGQLRPEPGR